MKIDSSMGRTETRFDHKRVELVASAAVSPWPSLLIHLSQLGKRDPQDATVRGRLPDELNAHLRTFVVAPLTTGTPLSVSAFLAAFASPLPYVVVDQIRTAYDQERIARSLGRLAPATMARVLACCKRMFAS